MGRQPCCDRVGLKRGPWTTEEDHKLMNCILNNGIQCWRTVPKLAGLMRCGKSCRLRWINYLRPDLKRGLLSEDEENQIIQLHARVGNRWSKIASHFPGRTDNEIKNHWNTRIKKRLKLLGVDPLTHQPIDRTEKDEDKTKTIMQRSRVEQKAEDNLEGESMQHIYMEPTDDKRNQADIRNVLPNKQQEMITCENPSDMHLPMSQENNDQSCSSYSSQFYLEDYLNTSTGESSSFIQEDPLQQWFQSVDSILSRDNFNQLEEDFFLFDKQ